MDILEKIGLGVMLFVITSVIAYLFKMRQLYLAVSKMYRHAALADKGSIAELVIYNKGNHVEEDIQVQLDPNLKCQLLASSTTDLKMHDSTITVSRLHKSSDISVVLLVEHGVLEKSKILSFSSKATKGLVVDAVSNVPPNYAKFFTFIFLMCMSFVSAFYIDTIMNTYHRFKYKTFSETLSSTGWSDYESYLTSDLKLSYREDEFPFRFVSKQNNSAGQITAVFDIYNKTTHVMKVYSKAPDSISDGIQPIDLDFFSSAEVPPMSKGTISVKVPPSLNQNMFSISVSNEFIQLKYSYIP